MNESLLPKTPTCDEWLRQASTRLAKAGVDSARLDVELILAHTLRKPRTYLHAHGEVVLNNRQTTIANARLELRCNQTPIAYIIGHKEFYGRLFKTTPAALIPRPESESFITVLKNILENNSTSHRPKLHLVDVGTGTGCLGITSKLEWPELDVTIIDNSTYALTLAKENASLLGAKVHVTKNDLLSSYGLPVDIIIANLPYVDRSWDISPDTQAEPAEALFAEKGGLSLIYRLLDQTVLLLRSGGYVLLESDPRQQDSIIDYAKSRNLKHCKTEGFITVFSRQ